MDLLSYDSACQVVVCKRCQTCIGPSQTSLEQHLRKKPHCLTGQILKSYLAYAGSLALRPLEDLKSRKPVSGGPALEHLKIWEGYQCLLCRQGDEFLTTHLPRMRDHMVVHGKKAKEHAREPLWQECRLQTYFTTRSRVDYFVVIDDKEKGRVSKQASDSVPLTQPEKELFEKLEKDYKDVRCDLEEQATIVQDIGDSRSERVP